MNNKEIFEHYTDNEIKDELQTANRDKESAYREFEEKRDYLALIEKEWEDRWLTD